MSDLPGGRGPDEGQKRAGKSAAAFRTISEVSGELDVPQHVLRFWETKFSQVKPLKRAGGRRYYRPEDVELLRRIRDLLYRDGFTIRGAQKFLREGGASRPPAPAPTSTPGERRSVKQNQAPPPAPKASPSTNRKELKTVLDELVAMRELLRRRLG